MKELEKIPEQNYVPKNLYLRLSRRYSAQYFIGYYFIVLLVMIIFGILFLHSVYLTRNYVLDGDKYWKQMEKHNYYLQVQNFNAFTGIFLICIALFSIMNNISIFLHILRGGLKKRLKYSNYIFFFFQIILFLYSFILLCMFGGLTWLYPVLFVFCFYNLLNSIIFFLLIKRCVRRENDFMLSMNRMETHKGEYLKEYIDSHPNVIKQ